MEKTDYILEFERPLRDLDKQLAQLKTLSAENNVDVTDEIRAIERKITATKETIYSGLNAWQKVQIARHPKRPYTLDYINAIFTDFQELHGDRSYGDDRAIVGGLAYLEGQAVVLIGQQKGRDTRENLLRNFGCPHPEGYRKALRLIRMAEKFRLPLITLIDTPGAFPGIGAEERHVSEAIALNIREMSLLTVPNISVIIGEGGSGGALGIGVANRVLIFENAYYSVISPEGCAAILWKDRAHAPRAAEALKLGAPDLKRLGVVDEVLPEPHGGAHRDPKASSETLRDSLKRHLATLAGLSPEQLADDRYRKYRAMGVFEETVIQEVIKKTSNGTTDSARPRPTVREKMPEESAKLL
jgi:acetyl-CoA carboxylase carboxyl transferase subunit alpha